MSVLTRLRDRGLDMPDADAWMQRLAARFCTNKPLTGMLCMMVSGHPPYEDMLRESYRQLSALVESYQAQLGDQPALSERLQELLSQYGRRAPEAIDN